ncbi:hypothetical protein M569_08875, partial [Genlisea aurea]
LILLLFISVSAAASPSPYLSAATLFRNHERMLKTFKIFIYAPSKPFDFTGDPASSLFYESLRRSRFLTENPAEADLFFVPFSPLTSTRSLARLVREIRNDFPFWNRTLGADHFYLSPEGIDFSSDRNALELKKNAIQVSNFPVASGNFIPHKDITLPPIFVAQQDVNLTEPPLFLAYLEWDGKTDTDLVNELNRDPAFVVDVISSPPSIYLRNVRKSKFCLFLRHGGDLTRIVAAISSGCVPTLIVDRPIQDLPLMDILKWSDLALFVAAAAGDSVRLKRILTGVGEEKFSKMRGSCAAAAGRHLSWNVPSQPLDAFEMVMYELWLRRHAVRYSRRE